MYCKQKEIKTKEVLLKKQVRSLQFIYENKLFLFTLFCREVVLFLRAMNEDVDANLKVIHLSTLLKRKPPE
jgi:hypothetical protein